MRGRLLKPAAAAVVLLCGAAMSGCTVMGTIAGGVIGGVLGGPDGAAAGAEAGMYMGMGADAVILESLSHPSHDHYDDSGYYEWYADDDYEDQTVYVPESDDAP